MLLIASPALSCAPEASRTLVRLDAGGDDDVRSPLQRVLAVPDRPDAPPTTTSSKSPRRTTIGEILWRKNGGARPTGVGASSRWWTPQDAVPPSGSYRA